MRYNEGGKVLAIVNFDGGSEIETEILGEKGDEWVEKCICCDVLWLPAANSGDMCFVCSCVCANLKQL